MLIHSLFASVSTVHALFGMTLFKRQACSVTSMSQLKTCLKSKSINIGNLQVPGGQTLELEDLASGTTVTFSGTVTFGVSNWEGPLVSMSGKGVTVTGSGILDGQGAKYWDGKGSNGGSTKPKFFAAHHLDSSTISGITLKNMPVHGFSILADGLTISGVTIDNKAGDSLGHNTDAFDIGSSTGLVLKNNKVFNQDDCVAINSGSDITISGMTCSGGHGLSIGSVGGRSNNIVKNVKISDSTVSDSDNGLRIKTVSGATGSVSGISWSNIKINNCKNGIVIEQDYKNGGPTGTPTKGVPITDVIASGITGTVTKQQIYILCAACSGFKFSGVALSGGSKGTVTGVTI